MVLGISRLVTGGARQLKYPEGRNPGLTEESGCQWYKVLLKVSWALRSLITWGESFNPQCDEVLRWGVNPLGDHTIHIVWSPICRHPDIQYDESQEDVAKVMGLQEQLGQMAILILT